MKLDSKITNETQIRALDLYHQHRRAILVSTDRLFLGLISLQWVAGMLAAAIVSPYTWAGSIPQVHVHVWSAFFLGGAVSSLPIYLGLRYPGRKSTRYVIAVAQMLWSALLIHLTGGRIETHFHVFGSLAFLAFYRDWKVFIPATIVVTVDHAVRGILWPESVYGVLTASPWRSVEHAGWVVFETTFLIKTCRSGDAEMHSIAEKRAKLETLAQKLRRAKAGAEAASEAKSMFLANVSHELRTPLNGVIGMMDLLMNSKLDAHQQKQVKVAQSSGQTLLRLISNVLDISKIGEGNLELESKLFAPAEIVKETEQQFLPRAKSKGIALETAVDPRIPGRVRGDPGRIQQILSNLIGNAIKFTERGSIGVRAALKAETPDRVNIKFTVADTGIGIPADRLEFVFESFTQVDSSTTRRYGGTGLGLASSKQLVEIMGGRIGAVSKPGNGSTFWFTISLEKQAEYSSGGARALSSAIDTAVDSAVPDAAELGAHARCRNADARILVVEDNEIGREIAMMTLTELGYECDVATNGREAVDAALSKPYHLVLMDCQMPEMDGFDATRIIRQHEEAGDLPNGTAGRLLIVALTANAITGDRERCLAAGMDDYITKPLKRDQLRRVIDECMNSNIDESMATAVASDVSEDPPQSQLDPDGAPPFHMEALVKRWGGKRDFVDTLIAKFLKQAPVDVEQLARAVEAKDVEEATRIAHGLKGAAGYVAAEAFGAIAASLEQMGRDGDMRNADALIDRLQRELNRCTGKYPPAETAESAT